MNKKVKAVWIVIGSMALTVSQTYAADVAPKDSAWYYKLGGGRTVTIPSPQRTTISLNANAKLGFGYSCGKFKPSFNLNAATLKKAMDNATAQLKSQYTELANSAPGAAVSYVLMKANPALYQMLQTMDFNFNQLLDFSVKTCQQMEAEMASNPNANPFSGWVQSAKLTEWAKQMDQSVSAVDAKDNVNDAVESGAVRVPYALADNQGSSAVPINAIGDVVIAGYNQILGRAAKDDMSAPSCGTACPRMVTTWQNPGAARDWLKEVVGETTINFESSARPATVAGRGIMPYLNADTSAIATAIQMTVTSNCYPQVAGNSCGEQPLDTTLDVLSDRAGGLRVTRDLLETIRREEPTFRGVMIDNIAEDLATSAAIQRVLLAKRILSVGSQIPEVRAQQDGAREVQRAIAMLDSELQTLKQEHEFKSMLVAGTSMTMLARRAERENSAIAKEVPDAKASMANSRRQ
ncbi:MAG: hypothetical protein OEW08_12625 [Gammaproteobacteria bacterium]|nr:hypothetical protein [Gammaproteobacteria bacterium]